MTGRVFLAGGGRPEVSKPLDEQFAHAIGAGPLAFWPVGAEPERYAGAEAWLRDIYEPFGVRDISTWTGDTPPTFTGVRGIYIGGGNTYRLLAHAQRFGLLDRLREYVATGGMVFGGSAGAALLGADISTVAHLDRNDDKVVDTTGADLAAGHAVFVHHADGDLPREAVWTATYRRPVLALTEHANAIVAGNAVTAVGPDPVLLVSPAGRRKLAPGSTSYAGSPA
ncbi:Type 1 glutamine amidotransferase-like domain-containing protein [Actinopolymorpha sp. NPDC004070]|uniref:Type 1 glutamine amidotransferase-like domain-containing protein n=1 Tax=Actinopolymorpha sp. NPDC004070 TaxID=3154548 RepID=UPI0033AE9699